MSYIVSLISTGPYTIQMHNSLFFFLLTVIHIHRRKPGFSHLKTPKPNYSTYEGALGGTSTRTHTHTHTHTYIHTQAKKSCYFKFPEEDIHHYTLLLLLVLLNVLFFTIKYCKC